jgi:hypothetical protein
MIRILLFITVLLIFCNCSKDSAHSISSVSGEWTYDYDSLSWESGKVYSPNINYWNFQSNGTLELLNEPGDHILDSFQYNQTSTRQMIWKMVVHTSSSHSYILDSIIQTFDTLNILILNSKNLYISCPITYIDSSYNMQNGVVFYTLSR